MKQQAQDITKRGWSIIGKSSLIITTGVALISLLYTLFPAKAEVIAECRSTPLNFPKFWYEENDIRSGLRSALFQAELEQIIPKAITVGKKSPEKLIDSNQFEKNFLAQLSLWQQDDRNDHYLSCIVVNKGDASAENVILTTGKTTDRLFLNGQSLNNVGGKGLELGTLHPESKFSIDILTNNPLSGIELSHTNGVASVHLSQSFMGYSGAITRSLSNGYLVWLVLGSVIGALGAYLTIAMQRKRIGHEYHRGSMNSTVGFSVNKKSGTSMGRKGSAFIHTTS